MKHQSRISATWVRIFCFLVFFLQASANASIGVPAKETVALDIQLQLEELLTSSSHFDSHTLGQLKKVSDFYSLRHYQPAWRDQNGLQERADELLHFIDNVHLEGVSTDGLHRNAIEQSRRAVSNQELARLDILLTDAFMQLSLRVSQGQLDPLAIDEEWHYTPAQVDVINLLQQAFVSNDIGAALDSLLPRHTSYQSLVKALAFYRGLADKQAGAWPEFTMQGPKLEYGSTGNELAVLRERLHATGDLAANAAGARVFDYELEQAVKFFQKRHGLAADGVVGTQTRLALAKSVDERIEQILLNLERWRWLPRDLGERHIRINLAGFELQVHDKDKPALSMRVIIGTDERKTPVFNSDMSYLVFNPYWNVPTKLAIEDLIPKAMHDPGYLVRKRIRVFSSWGRHAQELDPYSIDWPAYLGAKYLPYKFQQDPGPTNSLGRIKFMLPNPHSVYLHDTPSRSLFNLPVRTFSSGCVRVEDPIALASYVMGDKWAPEDIRRVIKNNKNKLLFLPEPIPVHVLYQTVWVDQAGIVQFRRDVYDKDKLLRVALPGFNDPFAYQEADKKLTAPEPARVLQN